tara:strand:- start:1050 stop:1280 length:231 start_codon:yes stop_codon:yes gene_type:complete
MTIQNKKSDIELTFERLESIIADMESGEVTLEQNLKMFEEGMKLIKECQSNLKKAEQKVENLIEESNVLDDSKVVD